mmetsp:Transcript_14615/g.43241  ORF Transcript_14615/g.43241 Transcript_14615/m.43241 type:complete len:426 (-) Transcript_14615:386-1663(-)
MRVAVSSRPTRFSPPSSRAATTSGLTSYLCRCRSDTRVLFWYNCEERLGTPAGPFLGGWRIVSRAPRRMVPPMVVLSISGMKITVGWGVDSSNSTECAPARPRTDRAYSTTSICMPRQIPRYGTPFSRAYLAVAILPSTPRLPNPPGTMIPSTERRIRHVSSCLALRSSTDWAALPSSAGAAEAGSSRSELSIHLITIFRFTSHAACFRALMTERYESCSPVYLPTRAMVTSTSNASMAWAMVLHFSRSGVSSLCWKRGKPKWSLSRPMMPWSRSMRGTWYTFDTSCTESTLVGDTWQKRAILWHVDCSRRSVERQMIMSGLRPTERSSFTPCWVGLVFCSPTLPRTGTNEMWTKNAFSRPTRNWNCRRASKKIMDSMSPTVPPTSMRHTSARLPVESTGITDTRSIQFWISFVMCGTTCTVLPR